jgi:hypothetical protein
MVEGSEGETGDGRRETGDGRRETDTQGVDVRRERQMDARDPAAREPRIA